MVQLRKRRRSLVRILASLIPGIVWKYILPGPLRVNFNRSIELLPNTNGCDLNELKNPPENFNSFKTYLKTSEKNSDVNLSSTPKVEPARQSKTMSEIQQLKCQLAKLLREHEERLRSNLKTFHNSHSIDLKQSINYSDLSSSIVTEVGSGNYR